MTVKQGKYEVKDGHNVSSRHPNNQPCPNCGTTVEKTKQHNTCGVFDGFECPECDVWWDWNEWANGVEKRPDPDPEQEMAPLSERKLYHARRDILHAIEDGRFRVETPRVVVGNGHFENIEWSIERDVQEYGSISGEIAVSAHKPNLEIELRWENPSEELVEDLIAHAKREGPCILYGDIHLWRMNEQFGTVQKLGRSEVVASFEWRSVETVGWR